MEQVALEIERVIHAVTRDYPPRRVYRVKVTPSVYLHYCDNRGVPFKIRISDHPRNKKRDGAYEAQTFNIKDVKWQGYKRFVARILSCIDGKMRGADYLRKSTNQ